MRLLFLAIAAAVTVCIGMSFLLFPALLNLWPHKEAPQGALTAIPSEENSLRGSYFHASHSHDLVSSPSAANQLPDFINSRQRLPAPILPENLEVGNLYWKTWELAFSNLHTPPPLSQIKWRYIDAAFSKNLFQWDSIFMMGFMKYAGHIFPAIETLNNFYAQQYSTGFIPREINSETGQDVFFGGFASAVNPPLFAWAELQYAQFTNDESRFETTYTSLVKYAAWLEKWRAIPQTKHHLYWNTGLGAGMDNSPRKNGSGWVDMSSQMVIMYQSLAMISSRLGKDSDSSKFQARAKEITDLVNHWMWDEVDGFYYDIDDQGVFQKKKTIAGFWPLLAHIPNDQQALRLVKHLENPKSFWRENVFPSLAADEAEYSSLGLYWLGSVWAPTNSMVLMGLKNYAKTVPEAADLIRAASEKYLHKIFENFSSTQTVWENYAPDSARRGLPSKQNFVGWSGIGPIQILIEDVLGFTVDSFAKEIRWDLHHIERHGITNLTAAGLTTNLVVEARKDLNEAATVTVESTSAYNLILVKPFGEKRFRINPGLQKITF